MNDKGFYDLKQFDFSVTFDLMNSKVSIYLPRKGEGLTDKTRMR